MMPPRNCCPTPRPVELGAVLDSILSQEVLRDAARPVFAEVLRDALAGGRLAVAVRLFGDGFTVAAARAAPKPARAVRRPRGLGAVCSLADLHAGPEDEPAAPLRRYDAHAPFLADVKGGVVPAELRLRTARGDVSVSIVVEDFLPRCHADYVAARDRGAAPVDLAPPAAAAEPAPPPSPGRAARRGRDDDAPSLAALRAKRLRRFAPDFAA